MEGLTMLEDLLLTLGGILVFATVVILLLVPYIVARRRGHPNAEAIGLLGFLGGGLTGILWVVALAWAYTQSDAAAAGRTKAAEVNPGRFRVVGVDRESKMDTSLVVDAWSEENARTKAEMQGMVVTAVKRM